MILESCMMDCSPPKCKLTFVACNAPAYFLLCPWLYQREHKIIIWETNLQTINTIFKLDSHMVWHPIAVIVDPYGDKPNEQWFKQWLFLNATKNFSCCHCIDVILLATMFIELVCRNLESKAKLSGLKSWNNLAFTFRFWEKWQFLVSPTHILEDKINCKNMHSSCPMIMISKLLDSACMLVVMGNIETSTCDKKFAHFNTIQTLICLSTAFSGQYVWEQCSLAFVPNAYNAACRQLNNVNKICYDTWQCHHVHVHQCNMFYIDHNTKI